MGSADSAAERAYVDQLVQVFRSAGSTSMRIEQLASAAKRPPELANAGLFKSILLRHPDLFEIKYDVAKSTWRVRITPTAKRGPQNPSLASRADMHAGSESTVPLFTEGTKPMTVKATNGHPQKMPPPSIIHVGEYELFLVETQEQLAVAQQRDFAFCSPWKQKVVSIDCEGGVEQLSLIQVATPAMRVFVFDCIKLSATAVCSMLQPLLRSKVCIKLFHDLHKDVVALRQLGGVTEMEHLLDTQLVAEHQWDEPMLGFNKLLKKLEMPQHPTKYAMKAQMTQSRAESGSDAGGDLWLRRPLRSSDVEYAALDATLLLNAYDKLVQVAGNDLVALIAASVERAATAMECNGARCIGFNLAKAFKQTSAELLKHLWSEDAFKLGTVAVDTDGADIINLLPKKLRKKLLPEREESEIEHFLRSGLAGLSQGRVRERNASPLIALQNVSDIVLDYGRRPTCALSNGERVYLSDNASQVTTEDDIEFVKKQVGDFGSDHRAGMDGTLHRISAIINRDGRTAGLTIRMGRSFTNNADMMVDTLLGTRQSVLVLGEPGSGKTTIIRAAAALLAERETTIIVDTSNEIAGDGIIPHRCIGRSRRMMVPSLAAQSAVMVECVQNHTPSAMVIDEIGRGQEVSAALTVKRRGVRMLASAHGTLRDLLKNPQLNGLLGGISTVTLGDDLAKKTAVERKRNVSKTLSERASAPTFEVVVEVCRGEPHKWRVVHDVAAAVDDILKGEQYRAQTRTRDPKTGRVFCELTYH